jgi:hypothetical protein
VRAAVLLDGGADPKVEVLEAVRPLVRRLARGYPSLEAYLEAMRALPYFQPWSTTLESYLREDVEILPDGTICSKSSAEAIERDLDLHRYYTMCIHFSSLQCPTLFIHPLQGLLGDRGHVLDDQEVAAIVASIPHCQRVDLPDVNHYTMLLHDDPPVTQPIRTFLAKVLVEAIEDTNYDLE